MLHKQKNLNYIEGIMMSSIKIQKQNRHSGAYLITGTLFAVLCGNNQSSQKQDGWCYF